MSARARAVRHVPLGRYRRAALRPEGHRIRWFVWAGDQKIPYTQHMRGSWGFDAECSCGWDSKVGGGTRRYVQGKVREHLEDAARPVGETMSAGGTTFRWNGSEWEHVR